MLSLFYIWYLIPAFALLCLSRRRAETRFILTITPLALASHFVAAWVWTLGIWPSPLWRQLSLALLTTAPVLVFLLPRLWSHLRRRKQSQSVAH